LVIGNLSVGACQNMPSLRRGSQACKAIHYPIWEMDMGAYNNAHTCAARPRGLQWPEAISI